MSGGPQPQVSKHHFLVLIPDTLRERELVASATRPRDKESRPLAHSANIVLKVRTLNSGAPSEAEVELGEGVGSLSLSFPLASLG